MTDFQKNSSTQRQRLGLNTEEMIIFSPGKEEKKVNEHLIPPRTKYPSKWNSLYGNECIQTHKGHTPANLIGKFN